MRGPMVVLLVAWVLIGIGWIVLGLAWMKEHKR